MNDTVKFGALVERCALKPKTAQYVLRTSGALSGMPKAGRQGSHRDFTLRQAVQLAICTHLVEGGVALSNAAKIVRYCESEATKHRRANRSEQRIYASKTLDPWFLIVDDGRYCRLWREQLRRDNNLVDEDDYFNIVTGKRHAASPLKLTRYQVNVTELEYRLWAWIGRTNP